MQFRCYTCGLVMHDGIPPLEALDKTQASAVGAVDADNIRRFDMLSGTKFDGLSAYQFCAFCLSMIVDHYSVFQDLDGHKISWTEDYETFAWKHLACSCGEELAHIERPGESWKGTEGVLFNRLIRLHYARVIYPKADLSVLEELVSVEA